MSPESIEAFNYLQPLPKFTFRNKLTWALCEALGGFVPWALLFSAVISHGILLYIELSDLATAVLKVFIDLMVILYAAWVAFSVRKGERVMKQHTLELAEHINSLAPHFCLDRWDEVARQMNAFFYQQGLWRSPYRLFDGSQCIEYFREHILKPYYYDTLPMEETSTEEAARNYESEVNELFKKHLLEKPPKIYEGFKLLPKDAYLNRFTFNLRYFTSGIFWIMLVQIWCFCFSGFTVLSEQTSPIKYPIQYALAIIGLIIAYNCFKTSKFSKIDFDKRVAFLAIIFCMEPAHDTSKWDDIARCMNQILRTEGAWKSREEKFFDGKECFLFFRKYLEPLTCDKRPKGAAGYYELKYIIRDAKQYCR